MSVIFSGIQPSGSALHLGNYIGAILNWKKIIENLKDEDKCYFMIADLHTLTSNKDPKALRNNTKRLLATYLACGIIPSERIAFFEQSKVPAHCELCWILSTVCPLGQLMRMTQFKDKKGKLGVEQVNAGLLYYPILMAADILLYRSNFVPVGEDQIQHLEFAKDIVQKFNNAYNVNDVFTISTAVIDSNSKRIMSLGDGTKKMSKSVGTDNDKIYLTDSNDEIIKKVKLAKTDSIKGIVYNKEKRPEVSNLITIYSVLSGKSIEEVCAMYENKGTKDFKDDLIEVIINTIVPIREIVNKILEKEEDKLDEIIEKGNKIANSVANETLIKVKKAVGLL